MVVPQIERLLQPGFEDGPWGIVPELHGVVQLLVTGSLRQNVDPHPVGASAEDDIDTEESKAIVARNKVRLTIFRYGILCVMCTY